MDKEDIKPVKMLEMLEDSKGVFYLEGAPANAPCDPASELEAYNASPLASQTIARAYKFHYMNKKSPLKLTKFLTLMGVPERDVCEVGKVLAGSHKAPAVKLHLGNTRALMDICITASGSCLKNSKAIQDDILNSPGVIMAAITDENDKLLLRCMFHEYITPENIQVMAPAAFYGPKLEFKQKLINAAAQHIRMPVYTSEYFYGGTMKPGYLKLTKGPNASKAHYDAYATITGKPVQI